MSCVSFREPNTKNIVDQILYQGQRLRNSMVQAILNNDPFSSDALSGSCSGNLLKTSSNSKSKLSDSEKEVFQAYFNGENLSRTEEKQALDTFRQMSASDLNEFVEKTSCTCSTCREYKEKLQIPPLKLNTATTYLSSRVNSAVNKHNVDSKSIDTPLTAYLRYIDSIKIAVHSVTLTQEGIRRLFGGSDKYSFELAENSSNTFFVDYNIPDCVAKKVEKSMSKVDSGLRSNNHVRICSKKVVSKAVFFKQVSFHELRPLDEANLDLATIKFEVTCRNPKQKQSNLLGTARFAFTSFTNTKYLVSNQQLSITLPNGAPILLGSIRASFQLGCGRFYGKELSEILKDEAKSNILLSESVSDDSDAKNYKENSTSDSEDNRDTIRHKNIDKNTVEYNRDTSRYKNTEECNADTLRYKSCDKNAERDTLRHQNVDKNTEETNRDTIRQKSGIKNVEKDFTRPVASTRHHTITEKCTEVPINNKNTTNTVDNLKSKAVQRIKEISSTSNKNAGNSKMDGRKPEFHQNTNSGTYDDKFKHSNTKYKNAKTALCTSRTTKSTFRSENHDLNHREASGDYNKQKHSENIPENGPITVQNITNPIVFFGFAYIPQVRGFTNADDTYFTCEIFGLNDVFYSRLVYGSENPEYHFQETIPFLYDDSFLDSLRENYSVFEFWKKNSEGTDILLGISKISIHQLFVAYRNPIIVKYLLNNELPVICCDWWEPISDPTNGKINGHAQILLAIGSERQINNLKANRGFEVETACKKISKLATHNINTQKKHTELTNKLVKRLERNTEPVTKLKRGVDNSKICKSTSERNVNCVEENTDRDINADKAVFDSLTTEKFDKAVQIDLGNMDDKESLKGMSNMDILETILMRLLEHQRAEEREENAQNLRSTQNTERNGQNTHINAQNISLSGHNMDIDGENTETNCHTVHTNTSIAQNTGTSMQNFSKSTQKVSKTSDLMDSLEQAILTKNATPNVAPKTSDSFSNKSEEKPDISSFRAHIVIESALHLPSRKKCKSARKSKIKNGKPEEILPSAYVTFETEGNVVKITGVVPKSSNPVWDYRSDVRLSVDLLFNNQKRLILKVWRKCNGNSTTPNLQTDLVIGFAALDLTALKSGLPSVQGWFNIMDLSGKCNGQIKVTLTPLENIAKLKHNLTNCDSHITSLFNNDVSLNRGNRNADDPSELISRALKRKFTELDEITQRLRLRLSKVTNEESDASNDGVADAFEHDINTLCVEDDFEMANFENTDENVDTSDKICQNNALLQFSELHIRNVNGSDRNVANVNGSDRNVTNVNGSDRNDTNVTGYVKNVGQSSGSHFQSPYNQILQINTQNNDSLCCQSTFNECVSDFFGANHRNPSSSSNMPVVTSKVTPLQIDVSGSSNAAQNVVLDRELVDGKQRIANLLEKLTLLTNNDTTADSFSNRYVSGCSVSTSADAGNNAELSESSTTSENEFLLASNSQRVFGNDNFSSGTSSSDNFLMRDAPDGQGHLGASTSTNSSGIIPKKP